MKINQFKILIRYVLIGLSLLQFSVINAQNSKDEQVKRLQLAIFVFNFAEQVTWSNTSGDNFKIGVLGPDRAILDFKSLAQKRKIKNKTVDFIRFNSVKDIKDVQLLYVNNSYNFDVSYILNKIQGKDILLVTEDYNYHTSMINMVNVGDSFEYEINSSLIEKHGLTISNSLQQYAITSSQKWKSLYESAEASLDESKKIEAQQQQEIENKQEEILSQQKKLVNQEVIIDTISTKVDRLTFTTELQKQKFEDKLKIERELEENIKQQIEF